MAWAVVIGEGESDHAPGRAAQADQRGDVAAVRRSRAWPAQARRARPSTRSMVVHNEYTLSTKGLIHATFIALPSPGREVGPDPASRGPTSSVGELSSGGSATLSEKRVAGCPYKKIYYNWKSGKAEKCIFCYPRIEAGQPTVCSETCVGRIRYLGVMLYDADRIQVAASVERDRDLYQAQCDIFLDPNDPKVIAQARADGIPDAWLEGARKSPVWKMAMEWKVALPLHPEYRTLPMVWYVPPLSPISAAANAGQLGSNGQIPDVKQLRIPVNYLANMLTAGDTAPVERALERMLAMRAYQRDKHVDGKTNTGVLAQVGLSEAQVEDMYHVMAIANYEDRFVIPSTHREYAENAFNVRGGCGFSFGNGCSEGVGETSLFGSEKKRTVPIKAEI